MSIEGTTANAVIRPWRRDFRLRDPAPTRADRGMPSSYWLGYATVTGDASGGYMACAIDIKSSTRPDSAFRTVEGMTIQRNDLVADVGRVLLSGIEPVIGGISPIWHRVFALVAAGAGNNRAGLTMDMGDLKAPPFRHTRAGTSLNLGCFFATNTTTVVAEFGAWGWIWDGEALDVGPRKPW